MAALRQAGAGRPSIKAPIKAKSPVIVHDQGKSRQTPKFPSAPVRWTPGAWPLELQVRPSFFAALRLCAFALKPDRRPSIKAPIKAKTPVIVHDQGKSRQMPKFPSAPVRWTPGAWPLELQVRPSFFAALRLCAFALKPDRRPSIKAPIKAKTPAIVHDQGKSRQRPNYSNAAVGRVTPCAPEVAGAGGARGCDPQQYPSARTYSHEHHRLHDSGHVAAAHRAMLRPPGCSHLRSSAFICGSSPRRASCSRVWRLSQLSSPVGIISVFSLNFTRQT